MISLLTQCVRPYSHLSSNFRRRHLCSVWNALVLFYVLRRYFQMKDVHVCSSYKIDIYIFFLGCIYLYNSSAATSGVFTSPNYPGIYPRSCVCKYYFYGGKVERVNISFETFHLDKMNGYVVISVNPRYSYVPPFYYYVFMDTLFHVFVCRLFIY